MYLYIYIKCIYTHFLEHLTMGTVFTLLSVYYLNSQAAIRGIGDIFSEMQCLCWTIKHLRSKKCHKVLLVLG